MNHIFYKAGWCSYLGVLSKLNKLEEFYKEDKDWLFEFMSIVEDGD